MDYSLRKLYRYFRKNCRHSPLRAAIRAVWCWRFG